MARFRRLKLLLCSLALMAVPIFAGQQSIPVSTVPIYAEFQKAPSSVVFEALEIELQSIMAPLGVRFEWHSLAAVRGDEIATRLVVLTFKGSCDEADAIPPSPDSDVLGWTYENEGAILPFSDIDCNGLRWFLHGGLAHFNPPARDELFGRALGRVVAHEIYHVLGNAPEHDKHGVQQAAYSVEDLLTTRFRFEQHEPVALYEDKMSLPVNGLRVAR